MSSFSLSEENRIALSKSISDQVDEFLRGGGVIKKLAITDCAEVTANRAQKRRNKKPDILKERADAISQANQSVLDAHVEQAKVDFSFFDDMETVFEHYSSLRHLGGIDKKIYNAIWMDLKYKRNEKGWQRVRDLRLGEKIPPDRFIYGIKELSNEIKRQSKADSR